MELLFLFLAFFVGCIFAVGDLVRKYPDSPNKLFKYYEVYLYLIINGIAAAFAYYIATFLNMTLGSFELNQNQPLLAIISGIGAMVILRSAIITMSKDEETSQIGLAPKLQDLLDWVERNYVKRRSIKSIPKIQSLIDKCNMSFSQIVKSLPYTCLNSIQGLTDSERSFVGAAVNDIEGVELISDDIKFLNLCITLHEITGIELLDVVLSAIDSQDDKPSEYAVNLGKIQELKKKLLNPNKKEPKND